MTVLVTGGSGFVGRAIVVRLLARGQQVRVLARGEDAELRALGVELLRGDVTDGSVVRAALQGVSGVFHVAAKVGGWGPHRAFYRTNVEGTQHVIAGCREHGVPKLVFTSSPSVVHTGGDMEGVDESLPYATDFDAHYPHTKALAEEAVLAANDHELSTVALRPHLVWGPGDRHLLPRAAARAKAGKLRLLSGPSKLVDTIYIDNAVDAHLAAYDRLKPGAACAGRAYFISQGAPIAIEELVTRVLGALDLEPGNRRVSPRVAYLVGGICELVYGALRISSEPPMTRFAARQLATSHHFDISAARRDLAYQPRVSFEEGLERLAAAYRAGKHFGRSAV